MKDIGDHHIPWASTCHAVVRALAYLTLEDRVLRERMRRYQVLAQGRRVG